MISPLMIVFFASGVALQLPEFEPRFRVQVNHQYEQTNSVLHGGDGPLKFYDAASVPRGHIRMAGSSESTEVGRTAAVLTALGLPSATGRHRRTNIPDTDTRGRPIPAHTGSVPVAAKRLKLPSRLTSWILVEIAGCVH